MPFLAWFWGRGGHKGAVHMIWKVEVKPQSCLGLSQITLESLLADLGVGQQSNQLSSYLI